MIIGSNIIKYDSLTSTNSLASQLAKKENPIEGTVILAGYQTEGKGQGTNRWISDADKNLLFSTILYPESVIPENQIFITMFVSLGICEFIDHFSPGSRIKKPNDIYLGKDKMAGMLIENTILENKIISSVVGIGLNINQSIFPATIPKAVSLKMITGTEHDTNVCLKRLLNILDRRYKELLYGDRKKLEKEFYSRIM